MWQGAANWARLVTTDLVQVFERLRGVLAEHSPRFVARTGGVKDKLDYQLWSEKDVVIDGRPRTRSTSPA